MVTTGQYAISSQAVSPWYNTGSQYRTREAQDVRVENGAGLIVGHTAQETISIDGATDLVPEVQVLGTAAADATVMLAAFSTTATIAGSPILAFVKGGNASIGSHTVVTNGEELGNIVAYGDDGTDLEAIAAQIQFEVDGTPGTGDMPGRIILATTADGAETATERVRISSAGKVFIANTGGLVVGHSAQVLPEGAAPELQVVGTGQSDSGFGMIRYSNNTSGVQFFMTKSRGASIGTNTTPSHNDNIGGIYWSIADTDEDDLGNQAAYFRASVDATATTDASPGRLEFATTANDATSATERMRITNSGGIFMYTLGSAGSGTALVIDGSDEIIPSSSSVAYKDDVRTIESDSSRVFDLTPRSFNWKRDGLSDFGLIAEEVHEVMPEMVIYNKDGNPEAVKYDRLSVLLLMELHKIKKDLEAA